MLEKPALPDEKILVCLREAYGIEVSKLTFLPLGADKNTAVYRILTNTQGEYFVKLRRGVFEETAVSLQEFLSEQEIPQIIAPIRNTSHRLWTDMDPFTLILYPYIHGQNGYETRLSDRQWIDFGSAIKAIHILEIPSEIMKHISHETYSGGGRKKVRKFLEKILTESYKDHIACELAEFLTSNRSKVLDLIERAERLAQIMRVRSLELIVCHSDLHAGNILVDNDKQLFIVDWDNPIQAPKERDLMSKGTGLFGSFRSPQEEESLFYQGYGSTQLDALALAYFRYERIIQDIRDFCEQLLDSSEGGSDREQSLRYLESIFLPGNTLEIAYQSDKTNL